jgi:hypothetical protein
MGWMRGVIERLKTGTYPDVFPYGTDKYPTTTYVVVRGEQALNDRIRIRVFVHYFPGMEEIVKEYVYGELSELLTNYQFEDVNQSTGQVVRFRVFNTGEWFESRAVSDDNTYTMERVFMIPFQLV